MRVLNNRRISFVLRAGYLRWLVLLALGWSQLLVAAHEMEHAEADHESSCAICVLLDRDDDSAVAADVVVPHRLPAPLEMLAGPASADLDVVPNYRSRASP